MPKRIIVQLRKEKQLFSRRHLAEVLDITPSTLNKWIKEGTISCPTGDKGRKYLSEEIEEIFEQLNFTVKAKLDARTKKDLNEIKASKLKIINRGIFLISPLANRDSYTHLRELTQRYGLWSAQGLNNHIHMRDYLKNPILQLLLAKDVIGGWIDQIRRMSVKGLAVIYLNGKMDSTLCIYWMTRINNKFVLDYDKVLSIGECTVRELR